MNNQLENPIRSVSQSEFRPRQERLTQGKNLRYKLPRSIHAHWQPPSNRRDPIDILEESNQERLPELIPIRYGWWKPSIQEGWKP